LYEDERQKPSRAFRKTKVKANHTIILQAKFKNFGKDYFVDLWNNKVLVVYREGKVKALAKLEFDNTWQNLGTHSSFLQLGLEALGLENGTQNISWP